MGRVTETEGETSGIVVNVIETLVGEIAIDAVAPARETVITRVQAEAPQVAVGVGRTHTGARAIPVEMLPRARVA